MIEKCVFAQNMDIVNNKKQIEFITHTAQSIESIKPVVHCKNCGVLCPPNEQHTIGVISHRPLKVCLAHLIWCARL